jgi:hypothetical protein
MRRSGQLRGVGELLPQVLRSYRIRGGVERVQALRLWPEVVGVELAKLTRARSVEGGVLYVDVRDSILADHLARTRRSFLDRLNSLLPAPLSDIRFAIGQLEIVPYPPVAIRPEPVPESEVAPLLREVPEPLRAAAARAAQAVIAAQRQRARSGAKLCQVCQTWQSFAVCRSCQELLGSPRIRRLADALQRRPESAAALSADELDAALYLAQQRLGSAISALLPEALQEAAYQELLHEQLARLLALRCRTPRPAPLPWEVMLYLRGRGEELP